MVGSRSKFLICLFLAVLLPVAQAASPESLSYRIYYKGWLSAMQELPIAEARLVTEQADAGRLEISTLTLSSAAHEVVDSLYPIRYRLRSLYDRQAGQLLAMERFKRTRKVKHDLAWVDAAAGQLHYLRAEGSGPPAVLPAGLQPWLADGVFAESDRAVFPAAAGLLDRLALLQALRREIPALGQVLTLPVTDGPKTFRYQVRLDGVEQLAIAGRQWPAWRLQVEGYEQRPGEAASKEADHAPILLWVSQDAQRLPLRFHIDHSVGGFTVEWAPGDLPVAVALDAPLTPAGDGWPDEG
jgi:hypothetical protein